MANAVLVASVVLGVLLGAAAYYLGLSDGRSEREEQEMLFPLEEVFRAQAVERGHAFDRAAEAVGLWPHRVTRRADLMRHVASLGTAPELGVVTPNPEREPSAAPVRPVPVGADHPLGVESGAEGRIDPMEGFL